VQREKPAPPGSPVPHTATAGAGRLHLAVCKNSQAKPSSCLPSSRVYPVVDKQLFAIKDAYSSDCPLGLPNEAFLGATLGGNPFLGFSPGKLNHRLAPLQRPLSVPACHLPAGLLVVRQFHQENWKLRFRLPSSASCAQTTFPQRTAPAVTLAAPPPSPAQPSHQPPRSLSWGRKSTSPLSFISIFNQREK
jgi:hypothetical protein